jgi:2-amino-4-hydroxy-6-hydroxymethyldihydropteridine diphosphokinase
MPARRIVRAYIGLGANVGDAAATLAGAVVSLDELPAARLRGVSRLYATEPWGVTDQPEFRNAAVALDMTVLGVSPAAAALALLGRLKTLERAAGRRRGRRWGPRELDLDLLVFGRHRISVERPAEARSIDAERDPARAAKRLEIPHRHLGERLFVLAPLADLAPRLVPPGWSETVETRRRRLAATDPPGSVRAVGVWDSNRRTWSQVHDSTPATRP